MCDVSLAECVSAVVRGYVDIAKTIFMSLFMSHDITTLCIRVKIFIPDVLCSP